MDNTQPGVVEVDPPNRWMKPGRRTCFAHLNDGTPLYPAYYPRRRGECHRRRMGWWDGASGEVVGVTLDGRLFRQCQMWGNDGPRPDDWEAFVVG